MCEGRVGVGGLTRRRWCVIRQVLGFLGVFGVSAVVLTLIFRTPLVVIPSFFLVLGLPLAYGRYVGRRRTPSKGVYWRGFVSFMESSLLADAQLFPDIHWRQRVGGWGRAGLCAGRGEVRDTGISWRSGALGTPQTEVSGTVELPWSEIESADAYRIPGKLPGLGGGITLRLT